MSIKRIISFVFLAFLIFLLIICMFEKNNENKKVPGGFMAEGWFVYEEKCV